METTKVNWKSFNRPMVPWYKSAIFFYEIQQVKLNINQVKTIRTIVYASWKKWILRKGGYVYIEFKNSKGFPFHFAFNILVFQVFLLIVEFFFIFFRP